MFVDRHDVLFALRSARRTPLLSSIVVLALSVGIGLNAGVFTILNYLMLDSPTRKEPSSFVQVYPRYEGFGGATEDSSLNSDDFDAIREQTHALSDIAAWETIRPTLDDQHQKTSLLLATCNYFRVFGIDRPLMGRLFLSDECTPGTSVHVAVLSEQSWKVLFSSDPLIVGKVIHVNGQPLTVVGVAPDDSTNSLPGGLWAPYTLQPELNHGNSAFHKPGFTWLAAAGRLRSGYSRDQAAAELQNILRRRDRVYLDQNTFRRDRKSSVVLTNGSFLQHPSLRPIVFGLLAVIMGPLSLVLLLACTNVTMLFLSRSIVRRGEIAVRLALGAGRARLMRMLAVESFLTASAAGVISIYLARRVPGLLIGSIDPIEGAFASTIQPDWKVFGYLAGLVLIATFLSALAPMRESFRLDIVTALKGREGTATMSSRTTSALIIVQIAMSFVLLAAAVLFARLPSTIAGIDPGFEARQMMSVPLDLEFPPYTRASAFDFHRTLETRILGIPGVQSFAYVSIPPLTFTPHQEEVRLDNQAQGQGRSATIGNVSSNFFSAFGIPLLHGRGFSSSDFSTSGPAAVAVVSQAFAKAYWGNNDAIGKVVVTPDDKRLTIVGVARDARSERFGMLDGPRLYTLRDPDSFEGYLYVRFSGSPAPVAASIAQAVKELDPSQLGTPTTIWDLVQTGATVMNSLARIILFMAAIAVILAITGVYAVLNFAINRRTREFGIRMTLGATREGIFRSVLIKGARQIVIGLFGGIVLAVPAAWTFARMTQKSTLPIQPFDITVYGIAALILLVVALCAIGLPAFRATQVHPMQALRNE